MMSRSLIDYLKKYHHEIIIKRGFYSELAKLTGGLLLPVLICSCNSSVPTMHEPEIWLTTPDRIYLLDQQPASLADHIESFPSQVIVIDPGQEYQQIDGFGFTLTGGSAILINKMAADDRHTLLKELFDTTGNGIGISYLRLSIGASDLSDRVFSYNDLPAGRSDPEMAGFSLDPDRKDLIPVLKEILEINPGILLMGSPWSPPAWMKDNNSTVGGSLLKEYYDAYALYLVRYIQEMAGEGIRIDAITVQNEPLHPGNNPSMLMMPEEQAEFIRESLGPAFRDAGLDTKIIIYDHNADRIDYPLTVLADSAAAAYIDGTAFHLYGGSINNISKVHEAYPEKNIYFTEQWIGYPSDFGADLGWHMRNVLIGSMRNMSRIMLQWNLASDPGQSIHTEGGCTRCLGAITIGDSILRNTAYYIVGHASRFVPPGSVRIYSTASAELPNVAFKTPDNRRVLIIFNDSDREKSFEIQEGELRHTGSLPPGAVATWRWKAMS